MVDLAVAVPTLVGSVLSTIAAVFIFACYAVVPHQPHFRHTLILNLAVADLLNSLNNTISGIYALKNEGIPVGLGCTLNGAISHLTDQATDFSILAIAITTLFTIRRKSYTPTNISHRKRVLISIGIWAIPFTTSFIGLILNIYQPIDRNWCWIAASSASLRYELGHGWRMTIILTVASIYGYLIIYIHQHFSRLRSFTITIPTSPSTSHWSVYSGHKKNVPEIFEDFCISEGATMMEMELPDCFAPDHDLEDFDATSIYSRATNGLEIKPPPSPIIIEPTLKHSPLQTLDPLALTRYSILPPSSTPLSPSLHTREEKVVRLLLLNAYPITYILLLLPFLLNQATEVFAVESRSVRVMESAWQYLGVANGVVFCFNERIPQWVGVWWRGEGVWKVGRDAENGKGEEVWKGREVVRGVISWPVHS